MSNAEFIQLAAGIVAVIASVIAAAESVVIRKLRTKGAWSTATAIHVHFRFPLTRWRLSRLLKSGAVVITESGLYFLDQEVLDALGKKRKAIVLPIALVLLAIALVLGIALFK